MAKKELKALLPSLRERKRYLAFKLISESPISNFNSVKAEIRTSMFGLIGDIGMAKADMRFIKDNVIMVNHQFVDYLRASLALVRTVNSIPVIIRSVGVSGMVKKAEALV